MLVRAHRGLDRAGLRLARAEDHARDPRVDHRAHAHLARLDGHVQRRAGQPVVAARRRRVAQRHDLRVRGRIVRADRLIESLADDRAVEHDDGADGHLARPPASAACASAARMNASGGIMR